MSGEETVHASAVAVDGAGLLILGRAGTGKSTLALALIAHGAELVADDRVHLRRVGTSVIAAAPEPLRGLIEARGIGLLHLPETRAEVALALAVDLDRAEPERLPPPRTYTLCGAAIDLVLAREHPALAPALLARLRGRLAEGWMPRDG